MIANNSQNLSCLRPKKFPLLPSPSFLHSCPPPPQLSVSSRHIKRPGLQEAPLVNTVTGEREGTRQISPLLLKPVTSLFSSHCTGQDKSHDYLTSEAETKSKNTATRSQKRFKLNTGDDVESHECIHQKRN